ncbi:hypothetical protein HJ01_02411 [Flavobacterium frigoris PS1]|uniref:Uncharacterized protein n=1 Tax=Flavobacterium frigoris (strain PS1) TaxID=1086011 RepID=H7FSZ2_FLAFP|nr:hypothetical protein HJ01_02411 [Flavobacterium frigoris PS1]
MNVENRKADVFSHKFLTVSLVLIAFVNKQHFVGFYYTHI